MSATIPPAPPPPPSLPSGGAVQAVVSVVAADPKVAQALAAGQVLEAVIQAKAARGVVEVALPTGTLTLKLPPELMALGLGAKLNLQVLAGDGNQAFQLRLLAVNGRLLLPSAAPFVSGGTNVQHAPQPGQPQIVAPQAAAAPPGAAAPAAPAGINATVLRPAVTPGVASPSPVPGAAGLPPDLAPGTTFLVRIAATALPGQALPSQTVAGQPATPPQPGVATPQPQATPQNPNPGVVPSQAPGTPAPPGAPQATPPQAPATPLPQQPLPLPAPQSPPVLTGTVTARPPGGQAVVQTPIGTLAVPSPGDLPVGSRLVLDVVGRPEPPPPAPPAAAKPEGLTQAGWPALAEAAETLSSTDAKAAEQLLRLIPQANHRMAASMAVFAGALRNTEVRALIGEAVTRGLEKAGKRGLVDRLSGDIEKLSAESTRTLGGGEWRAYTMPFLHGAEIDPIRLYVRTIKDEDSGGGKGGGQGDGERFILDIDMRKLGRVQLDGMVRRDEKSFDLIMRTQEPLPQDMRRDILAIFAENCDACGTKGVVVFQSGRFVDLPPDAVPTTLTV